jgi:hypothetical protein
LDIKILVLKGGLGARLGLSPDSLEQLEEEAEYALAKAELEDLKHTAVENIETYKRRQAEYYCITFLLFHIASPCFQN